MITKEIEKNEECLFCVSEYHLELILLPYIKEEIYKTKFLIFTEYNLEKTLKELLDKININENLKKQIINIDWNKKDEEDIVNNLNIVDKITIIINGSSQYIEKVNSLIRKKIKEKIKIINCFNIEDNEINVEFIKKHKKIIKTKKI